MSYVPAQNELLQIFQILQVLRDPTNPQHLTEMANLPTYSANGQFVLALLHIFSRGKLYESQGLTTDVRQLSGLILKNNISPKLESLDANVQNVLKTEVLNALTDTVVDIRKTASIVIGSISSFPIENWIDILSKIIEPINPSTEIHILDGSLLALRNILEDSSDQIMNDSRFMPLESILQRLSSLFSLDEPSVLCKVIECYIALFPFLPDPTVQDLTLTSENSSFSPVTKLRAQTRASNGRLLLSHMDTFLGGVFRIASSPIPAVRKIVCQSLVQLSIMNVSLLLPHLQGLAAYMTQSLSFSDEIVAMEAAEFWITICEHIQYGAEVDISPFLPSLIPTLLNCMVYTEATLKRERDHHAELDEEDDDDSEDQGKIGSATFTIRHHFGSADRKQRREREEEELDLSNQSLRKSSSRLLELITSVFPASVVLPICLPIITTRLSSSSPWELESAVLTLGVISAYLKDLAPHLPQIVPSLIATMQNPSNLLEVRCISCWTLSRFTPWMLSRTRQPLTISLPSGPLTNTPYMLSLQILLGLVLDSAPRVQVSALSALSMIFESAQEPQYLVDVLAELFRVLNQALSTPTLPKRARTLCFDLIAVVASVVGGEFMSDESLTAQYFPHVYSYFMNSTQPSPLLLSVLECLQTILPILPKPSLQASIVPIYTKCFTMLNELSRAHSIQTRQLKGDDSFSSEPQDDLDCEGLIVCCLDTISAISEAYSSEPPEFQQTFRALVAASPIPLNVQAASSGASPEALNFQALTSLLFSCLHDPSPPIRQSSFSLAGELCKSSATYLLDSPDIVMLLFDTVLQQLRSHRPGYFVLVTNNAVWLLSEMILALGTERASPALRAFGKIPEILELLMNILVPPSHFGVHSADGEEEDDYGSEEETSILKDNLCILLGRLCSALPLEMGTSAPDFLVPWCGKLHCLVSGYERDHTFEGLSTLLHANPALLNSSSFPSPGLWAKFLEHFILACTSWEDPPSPTLQASLSPILVHIKNTFPSVWSQVFSMLGKRGPLLLAHFKIN